jgi:hypothetical protein
MTSTGPARRRSASCLPARTLPLSVSFGAPAAARPSGESTVPSATRSTRPPGGKASQGPLVSTPRREAEARGTQHRQISSPAGSKARTQEDGRATVAVRPRRDAGPALAPRSRAVQPDLVEQLRQLGKLRDAGMPTDTGVRCAEGQTAGLIPYGGWVLHRPRRRLKRSSAEIGSRGISSSVSRDSYQASMRQSLSG